MLSRKNSDAGTRLRRAKSSASVTQRRSIHSHSESIDPEISRQHALIASNIAMERASERASTETRRSNDLSRANSGASRSNDRFALRSRDLRFAGSTELHRQRSLLQSHTPGLNFYSGEPYQHSEEPLHGEFGGSEQYGAQPSSYRKLRKAKSLFTPNSRALSLQQATPRSVVSRSSLLFDYRSTGDPRASLKSGLQRSISFLKESGGSISRTLKKSQVHSDNHEEAIQMARDQFLQSFTDDQQDNLSEKPASLFPSKTKRQQKPFRKTVRSTRTTDFGNAISSPTQCVSQQDNLVGDKTRIFSRGLRQKVNRLFRRSTNNCENVPIQHLDASRPHFRDYAASNSVTSSHVMGTREREHCSDGSYISSTQHNDLEANIPDIPSPQGSLRSIRSADSLSNSRSRVTSWTDSTVDHTIADRLPMERKRLSVIQENGGPHQPSSSAGMHKGGIMALQSPLQAQTSSGRLHAPVDSQRIYSALIRRLDEVEDANQSDPTIRETDTPEKKLGPAVPNRIRASRTIRAVPWSGSLSNTTIDHTIRECSSESDPSKKYMFDDASVTSSPRQLAQTNDATREPPSRRTHDSNLLASSEAVETSPNTPSSFELSLVACRKQADLDEDTSSVIISRQDPNGSITSASIYSRTTSGNTPVTTTRQISGEDENRHTPMSTIDQRMWQADPASISQDVDSRPVASWKTKMNDQILSVQRRGSNRSHFREKAQIGEDDDSSLGTKQIRRAPPGGRPLFPTTVDASHVKSLMHQPSCIAGDRPPLLELKQVPRNAYPEPRQSSEHFTPAREHWKRNDENKRLLDPKTSMGRLRLKISQRSLGSATGLFSGSADSLPGGHGGGQTPPLPPQSSTSTLKRVASYAKLTPSAFRSQSQVALAAGGGSTPSTSGNESGSAGRKKGRRYVARLSRPFDAEMAYRCGSVAALSGEELGGTAAEEKAAEEAGQGERGDGQAQVKVAQMSGFLSRKRMVSNFLRSRKREREREREGRTREASGTSIGSGAGAFL